MHTRAETTHEESQTSGRSPRMRNSRSMRDCRVSMEASARLIHLHIEHQNQRLAETTMNKSARELDQRTSKRNGTTG